MIRLTINTDGGARGNPGPAAIGVVINYDSSTNTSSISESVKLGKYIGNTTNNVAEYSALVEALSKAKELNATHLDCFLDSELVVKQLNGQYKVKDSNMQKLWAQVKSLEKHFEKVTYTHIPRSQNKEADKIVNEVLDSATNQNA